MSIYEKAVGFDGLNDGFTETFDDEALLPKKRGRKKKSVSEKNEQKQKKKKVEAQIDNENSELIEALIKGDEIDDSLLDEVFEQYSPKIDLVCDTTGTINKLRNSKDVPEMDDEEDMNIASIIKWCQLMMSKDTYTDEETEAFETIKELMVHIGMTFEEVLPIN